MRIDAWADEHVPPMAALAVAIAAVSTSAILVRWSTAPGVVKAFYRVLFMTALVAPVAWRRDPGAIRAIADRDLLAAVGAGVALAAHFAVWFESLRFTSVAASVTLVQSQPIFVAIGASLLLGETVTKRTVGGILVAVGGAAAMTLADPGTAVPVQGKALLGNGLAIAGAVAFAGYALSGRSIRQRVGLFPYVTVVYAVATVTLFAFVVGRGVALGHGPGALAETLLDHGPVEWVLFLAMAVLPGIFGHTVVNWALEHVESSVVSVSLLGEPVGSTLLALVLLSEVPTPPTVLGGAVVLLGIWVTTTGRDGTDT